MTVPGWLVYLVAMIVVWVFATGDWHPVQYVWALLVGLLTLPLAWGLLDLGKRHSVRALGWDIFGFVRAFVVLFIPDAVMSTFDMAKRVIQPVIPMYPGIVGVPIRFRGPVETLLLSNHLTLTPGQLVVDYDPVREILYIHTIDARDPDKLRRHVHELLRRARERIGP